LAGGPDRWLVARIARRDGRRHLALVTPDAVVHRHRRGWRLRWRRRPGGAPGRPRLGEEVRDPIARIAKEDPPRGAERVRGELLELGAVVGERPVQRDRRRGPARPPSRSRRTFPRDHRASIWAADRPTVRTRTLRTSRVRLLVRHARRGLVHLDVTAGPTAARVRRQLVAATPRGGTPRSRGRDRGGVHGREFVQRARRLGVETLLTPVRAPTANGIAERRVGTPRRGCLDGLIVVNAAHPRAAPTEFADDHDRERPHRTLARQPPEPHDRPRAGPTRARPVLGGLHHVYRRAA
jgi:putative transposase